MAGAHSPGPTAFEKWELPNVGPRVASGQRVPPGTLTASQVEAVQTQAFEEASRDGHSEGYAKGYAEGCDAGRAQAQASVDRLRGVIECLAEPLAVVDEELEQTLLHLTLTVAQQLIRRELKTDPGQVLAGIRQAVSLLGTVERQVKLQLHREDIELIKELGALDLEAESWRLIEDPSVSPGGCRVQSGASFIDATVEHRLATVVAQVFGGDRREDGVGG